MYTVKDLLDTSYVNLILGVQDGAINKWEASRKSISLFQISTSRSESLSRVITLTSLVCSYFELDIELDAMRKHLLIKQEAE